MKTMQLSILTPLLILTLFTFDANAKDYRHGIYLKVRNYALEKVGYRAILPFHRIIISSLLGARLELGFMMHKRVKS